MSWSFGEIRSLAYKAARGAGFDWGMAEEAGDAVEWLERHGAPGAQALADYLTHLDERGGVDIATCPIFAGCRISDLGGLESAMPNNLCQSILLAPFISRIIQSGTVTLTNDDGMILISRAGIGLNIELQESCEAKPVSIKYGEPSSRFGKPALRVADDRAKAIETLNAFAYRTYVPATAASREKGAGAGLTDND